MKKIILLLMLLASCRSLYNIDTSVLECDGFDLTSIKVNDKNPKLFTNNLAKALDYKLSKYFNGNTKICQLNIEILERLKNTSYRDTGEVARQTSKTTANYKIITPNNITYIGQVVNYYSAAIANRVYATDIKRETERTNTASTLAELLAKDIVRLLLTNNQN